MTPPIEYLIRDGKVRDLLSLPTSLFLTREAKKPHPLHHKAVVLLLPRYGDPSRVIVRHYLPWKATPSRPIPPYHESVIPRDEVFSHPRVILKGHKLLGYKEDPFVNGHGSLTDMQAHLMGLRYHDCLANYFRSKVTQQSRTAWLWGCFLEVHVKPLTCYKDIRSAEVFVQMEVVGRTQGGAKNLWLDWKRLFLDFNGVAPELVFSSAYGSKIIDATPAPEFEMI